jgi:regulatory protein
MAAGVRLLAGREYSRLELANKLSRRFSAEVIDAVVEELISLKVLDDERYGEAFCRSRVERGYGPGYIARELEQNGLGTELVDTLLEPYQGQWFERALAQAQKAHRPKRRSFQPSLDPQDDAAFFRTMRFWRRDPPRVETIRWTINGKSGKRPEGA